jgi:hypothetical protein
VQQPYGRKDPCKYVCISHRHINTRTMLKMESSNFLVMAWRYTSLIDYDVPSFL